MAEKEKMTAGQLSRICAILLEKEASSNGAQGLIMNGHLLDPLLRAGKDVLKRVDLEEFERLIFGTLRAPANLAEILESQIERFHSICAYKELGISWVRYSVQLRKAVEVFLWRSELAKIGLTEVMLVDYRLLSKFLAEVAGVTTYIDPDNYQNFKGVITPDGILVIQYQSGEKYRNKAPLWCQDNFHPLEQGGIVKEGLTSVLHNGKRILDKVCQDLPGSVSPSGGVPYLGRRDGDPGLAVSSGDDADPEFGSLSRGKK